MVADGVQDGARQALCDYINKAGKVLPLFDFPTKGILQEAVKVCATRAWFGPC